jgi:hypothetical protein
MSQCRRRCWWLHRGTAGLLRLLLLWLMCAALLTPPPPPLRLRPQQLLLLQGLPRDPGMKASMRTEVQVSLTAGARLKT